MVVDVNTPTISTVPKGRRGFQMPIVFVPGVLLLMAWVGVAAPASDAKAFKLREVSAFSQNEYGFIRGQRATCAEKPLAAVKKYPTLVSTKPVYGSVRFAADYGKTNEGMLFHFVIDESRGTGKGYDRLHFDRNADLDLDNDKVISPQQRPPDGARLAYSQIKQQVIFGFLVIEFDCGTAGMRPVEIMPRFTVSVYDKDEYKEVSFVRTKLYQADIKIGNAEHQVQLGNDYVIYGGLDNPNTALVLRTKQPDTRIYWWGGDRLKALHKIGGTFFSFSANPVGDELTVSPYQGDLGTFEIGPGDRKLTKLGVSGSLEAKDRAIALGDYNDRSVATPVRKCELPVGDYLPNYINVEFGKLRISISHNYHSDGKPRDRGSCPLVYGMTVRKDKPYVLDFSDKPDVMFASPAAAQTIKPGDELSVKAVLVDPKLDFMIRGLEDTTRKQTGTANAGRFLSLDPKVVITRANGEKVTEGVMPFG